MKNKLKNILKWTLKTLAEWTLRKYQPGIVGVTGSVGKTSTKEAVAVVLRSIRSVRVSNGNFNNEIGLPLTILGNWNKVGGIGFWLKVLAVSVFNLIFPARYPEILVLEYGADKPGDIKYLTEIAKPQISIVTAIGDIPSHIEFYSGPDAVAREKARLVEVLPVKGFAILNFDDEAALNMRDRTRAHVVAYGFGEEAELRITNFENRAENNKPIGISFKLQHSESFVPVRLDGVFGRAQAYAAAAAACVGLTFGMNLVRISEALKYYQSPPHRMRLLSGAKNTYIIDDTYNASPLSMREAIETVKHLGDARKVGVLGDMLEIGKYAIEAHEDIGRLAAKVFKILITIGPRAKFIAESANKAGMAKKSVYSFDTAEEAKIETQNLIKEKDLILVKASRAMKLEKIVEEIQKI